MLAAFGSRFHLARNGFRSSIVFANPNVTDPALEDVTNAASGTRCPSSQPKRVVALPEVRTPDRTYGRGASTRIFGRVRGQAGEGAYLLMIRSGDQASGPEKHR